MVRSGLLPRNPGDVASSPRTSAPSTPIDASPLAHRGSSLSSLASPSRLALFVSPAASARAEAVAARVKLCAGLDCEWFTVNARAPEGVPRIDPVVLGADALAATLAGARREKENASPAFASRATSGGHSPAALIAKGEAAVRLGDHARANDAFAKARAANDAAERARSRERDESIVDVSPEANARKKIHARAHVNARAVASAFAPVVVAVLENDEENNVSSYASLKCVLDDVLSKGNSARGGALIVLGTIPETAAASVRRRCESLGVAYVQCALVDFDEAHISSGAVDVWVASADGPQAMNCAEAVVLGAIAGGAEMDEDHAEASAVANGHSNPRIRRLASGDPRDAASPRAAVLASLLAAQAEEIRNMQASAATAAEAKAMRALRDDADAAAKEACARAAIETDRASFLELALQQERAERDMLRQTMEHAHREKTSKLERDHARDRARFAAAEISLRNEIDARGADADEMRARFESQSVAFFETREEEQRLRTELERLTLAYDRLAVEKRTETDRLTSRVDALRDALGASRAETNDLTRLLSGEEKTNPQKLHSEDAFAARDRAEADATAVRGLLAEAVTEQRRWRARCDAAERRAAEAEKRAERDAMRAVVADARAASFRETMRVTPGHRDESAETNDVVSMFASPQRQPGQRRELREQPENDVPSVVHPALVETPGPGVGATPGPAAPRYLPSPAFPDLETRLSAETNAPSSPREEEAAGAGDAADSGVAEEEQNNIEVSRDLALALSRAAAAEKKLVACEAKLRLAETATKDAETREARAKLLAESERHEHRDFEATVSGLKRAILEARAETRAAKAAAEAETKTARESVKFSETAAHELVEAETKRRVAAERERDAAREDAASARKRADSVRAEAERLLERAEICEDETSFFPEEEDKKMNGGLGEDARLAKTGVVARVAVPATPEDVVSEREAVLFAAARCAELERAMPGARACVARKTTSHKLAVVAAGAMSPLVRWFGARGWSSKIARGGLAHVCLSATARERTANGRRAYAQTVSTRLRRVDAEETSKKKEKRDANVDASLALLRHVACVGLKTANEKRGAGSLAVACGSLGDLAIFVDCSDRLTRTSLRDLANAHAAADAVAAAFDAADDAADDASRALFVSTRALMNSEDAFEFDSSLDAIRALETHAARRHVAETTCRRRYRGGDGCLTRVVDAGAFFLASAFFSEEEEEEEEEEKAGDEKAAVCAAAAVLAHVARAAGIVAGVGGVAVVPRAARDALAALSEASEAVEAREKEKAEETELAEAMGIFPKHKNANRDEDVTEAARLSSRRREAAFEAARRAAPLWSSHVGSRSETVFSEKTPKDPREKEKTAPAFAVVSLLVRGEDGRDKMRDRAVDAFLGPERDLADVEALLRVTSAPLAYALESEKNVRDDAHIATRAARALWLWTASCVAIWRVRRVVRATARPGAFDLETVDAELRRRRKAASVLGRYWRAHAERFFSNARRRRKRLS